jgi:response regulator RpfG family c-di-GMP phosphodiesterase
MDPERVKKYAADGVKHFYILARVRKQFINYMNEMMKPALEEKNINAVKLMGQGLAVTEILLEEIQTSGLKPGIMEECKALARNMNTLIGRSPLLSWKLNVNTKGKHGRTFLTMFYSLLMCRHLSWVGDRTVETIALGSLLLDIGELKLPPALRDKDPSKMTESEFLRYQDHPRLGAEMLSSVPELSPQVIEIVLQHHENFSGDGYPMGLHGSRIYPLAKFVSLAEGLAVLITRNDLSVLEGLRQFLQDREAQTKYDPVLIRALIAGFTDQGVA